MQRAVQSPTPRRTTAPPASPSLTLKPLDVSAANESSGVYALVTPETTTTTASGVYAFDALLVATSVACTLLVVLVVVLILGVRLLKRVASAAAVAEAARAERAGRRRRQQQQQQQHPPQVYGARVDVDDSANDAYLRDDEAEEVVEVEGDGEAARDSARRARGRGPATGYALDEAQPLLGATTETGRRDGSGHGGGRRRRQAASQARDTAYSPTAAPASMGVIDALTILFRVSATAHGHRRDASTTGDDDEDSGGSARSSDEGQGRYRHPRWRRRHAARERGSSSTAAGQRRFEDASAFGGDDDVDSPCAAAARRRGRQDQHSPAAILVGRNGSLRGGRSSRSSSGNDAGRRPRAAAAVRPAPGTSACGQASVSAAGVPPSSRRGHASADCGASDTHGSLQPASASGRRAAAQEAARAAATTPTALLPVFTATTEKDKVVYNTTHDSRYRLLQRIGTGAFSSVYLVQHKTTGQRYALKYILCKDDRERVAALRECELIHTLQGHPQVIRIVDMFMNYQFQGAAASPTGGAGEEKSGAARSFPVEAAKPTAVVAEAAPPAAHPRQHAAAPATSGVRPSSAATSATAVSTSLVLPQASPATTRWVGVQLKGLGDTVMTKVASATRLDDAEVTAALQSRIRRLGVAVPQRATPAHGRQSLSGDEGEEGSGGARLNACWAGGSRGRPAATAAAAAPAAAARGAVDEDEDGSFASTAGGLGYVDESDAASGRGTAVHADYDGLASSEQPILSAADTERLLVDARRLQRQRRRQREQQRQQRQHREQQQQQQQQQQQPQTRTQPVQTTQSQQGTWRGNASASASSFDGRSLQYSMQRASRSNSSSVNLIAHPFGVSPTSLGTPAATTATAAAAAAAATTFAAADYWCKTPNINTHVSSVGSPGAVPAASQGRPRIGSTAPLSSRGALARAAGADACLSPACERVTEVEDVEGDATEAGAVSATAAATTTTAAISGGGLSGTALHTGTSRGGDTSAERSAAEGAEAEDEGDAAETASAHDAGTGSSSSVTSTSGEEEEPTQPIHRILVPPPSFMHPPPASPAAATAAAPRTSSPATPPAHPPTAVGTPDVAAATTATATASTFASYAPARSAMNGGAPAGNRYSNFPLATAATALKPPSAAAADTRTATSPAPSYAPSSPVANAGSPHASAPAASRELPLQTSSVAAAATYAPARASAPAGTAVPMEAPVRYKDFTPAHTSPAAPSSPAPPPPSASWAGMLRESSNFVATQQQQQQQPPHNASVAQVCPVPQSYGNYRSPTAQAAATGALVEAGGAMPTPPVGLARDRQTGAYVNPYLSHATDAQEAPAPARTSYAPRGGVRYSGLVVPPSPTAGASMAATATTAPASYGSFMTPSNGVTQTGNASTLASSGIATSGAAASSSASGTNTPLSYNGHGAAPSSYAPAAPPRNTAAAPVPSLTTPAPAVRNTYAPLRYGNLIPPALSPPSVALPSQLHLQKQLQEAELYPTNIASPTACGSADVGAARGDTSAPFPASSGEAGLRWRLSVSAAIRAARAGQQGERMHGNDGKPHIHVPVSVSAAVTAAQAPHRPTPLHALQQQQQPAVGGVRSTITSAPPYDDAPSPTKPQYTNLGVLLAGGSMTDGPGTPKCHGAAQEARARDGLQPSSPARRAAFGSAAEASAAAVAGPSVRYANVGTPQAWTATGAGSHTPPHVDAACAAAVAALTGVPLKAVSGGVAAAPSSSPSGSPTGRGAKSSTTSASVNSPTTSSGSLLLDARDTGYLCLVMEYHPMGDLCRYALRAKHQLELHQQQQQQQSSPTPRPQLSAAGGGGVVSGLASVASPSSAAVSPAPAMVTSASTLHTATEDSERSSVPRQHLHPLPSTTAQADVHGDGSSDPTTAASLIAAAAVATWRMRPAASRSELPLVASAGAAGQPSAPAMDEYADTHELPSGEADPTSDNPLTEAQLLSIAYQLASVLDHMHRQNPPIIHRDLKPENILVKGELTDYLDLSTLRTSAAAVAAAAPQSWTTTNDAALPASAAPDGHARPATAAVREHGSNSNTSHARLGANQSVMDKSSTSPVTPSLTPAAVRAAAAAMGTSGPLPPIRITRAVVPVVLTDFGLAILQDVHGRPHGGRGGGTRPYIAPESWHGGTCTASDVWSLGCVLYALATCRLVAKNVRIMSQEAKQDGFASRMLNDILAKRYSLAFASFVVSLLVVDPVKRPTAAQASQCFCVADGEVRFDPNSPFFSNVLDL